MREGQEERFTKGEGEGVGGGGDALWHAPVIQLTMDDTN